ncbi:MAG: hypothetical protein IT184_03810 [Acidobacteria bacterium]|nr:hypothetical protein [Acidobacteriota bacterium]
MLQRTRRDAPQRLWCASPASRPTEVDAETYYASLRGVVLTPGRAPAWVPVKTAEWLAFRERSAVSEVDRLKGELEQQRTAVDAYRADMERSIAQASDAATKARRRTSDAALKQAVREIDYAAPRARGAGRVRLRQARASDPCRPKGSSC